MSDLMKEGSKLKLVRVMSIEVDGNKVIFREECDGYFSTQVTKEKAITMLEEMINHINDEG